MNREHTVVAGNRACIPASLSNELRVLGSWLRCQPDHRLTRPWLGSVGVALAVSAVVLTDIDIALPVLALCAWWWCVPERFAWLVPLGAGVLTVAWVTVGTGLIAILPLPTAGLLWASFAAAVALLGAALRILLGERPA